MFQGRIDYDRILCPIGLDSLKLVGNVGSERFEYFKVYIKACEENEVYECADKRTISEASINLAMIQL